MDQVHGAAEMRWRLKSFVHVVDAQADRVLLTRLGQRVLIKSSHGPQILKVLEFLKAPRTQDELFRKMADEWPPRLTDSFLKKLEAERLLTFCDSDSATTPPNTGAWSGFAESFCASQSEAVQAQNQFLEARPLVLSPLELPGFFFERARRVPLNGFREGENVDQIHFLILSSLDHRSLESISRLHQRFVPVLLDPYGAVVGPLSGVDSGRPCLSCVSQRLRSNMEYEQILDQIPTHRLNDVVAAWPPSYWQRLSSILEEETFKLTSKTVYSSLQRGALIFDFLNHRSHVEDVFPVPGCSCSMGLTRRSEDFLIIPT